MQKENKLYGKINITQEPPKKQEFKNTLEGTIGIVGAGLSQLPSVLKINHSYDILSRLTVAYRNILYGAIETAEPPTLKTKIYPVADAFVRSDMPTVNFGAFGDMFVGNGGGGKEYRSFLKFNISSFRQESTIVSAKLVLRQLNTSQPIKINIYETPTNWEEYGITWANQPKPESLINSYESIIYPGKEEIDITNLVINYFLKGNEFSLVLIPETYEDYKQYGTRESSYPPYLEIEYKDPYVFSYGRNDLSARLRLVYANKKDLPSRLAVKYYTGKTDLQSSLKVRDPRIPVTHDLISRIAVTRNDLISKIDVLYRGNSDIYGSIIARFTLQSDVQSRIIVSRSDLHGFVTVTPYHDVAGRAVVRKQGSSTIHFTIAVNRPDLVSRIKIPYYSDLKAVLLARPFENNDIGAAIIVSKPDLISHLYVPYMSDIPSRLLARQSDSLNINATITVSKPDLISHLYVPYTSDIPSRLLARQSSSSDIQSKIFIISPNLAGRLRVRTSTYTDILAKLYPRLKTYHEINAQIKLRASTYRNLQLRLSVRRTTDKDMILTLTPRVIGVSDLYSVLSTTPYTDLPVIIQIGGEDAYAFIL